MPSRVLAGPTWLFESNPGRNDDQASRETRDLVFGGEKASCITHYSSLLFPPNSSLSLLQLALLHPQALDVCRRATPDDTAKVSHGQRDGKVD